MSSWLDVVAVPCPTRAEMAPSRPPGPWGSSPLLSGYARWGWLDVEAECNESGGSHDHPGFDLLSEHATPRQKGIEVKGRSGIGDVDLTENEWSKACNQRDRCWPNVVFDCGTAEPGFLRVQDPFKKLVVESKRAVIGTAQDVLTASESDRDVR